jgi:hypothetical protein
MKNCMKFYEVQVFFSGTHQTVYYRRKLTMTLQTRAEILDNDALHRTQLWALVSIVMLIVMRRTLT